MCVCPLESGNAHITCTHTHSYIHYIRYIHFYFHLMDGIWHYACCTNAHLVIYFILDKNIERECDGREYIEIIIWAGYVFFNNLDCVRVHDNDESTEVMMTKTVMVIIRNSTKQRYRRNNPNEMGMERTRETLFENQMWLIFRRKKKFFVQNRFGFAFFSSLFNLNFYVAHRVHMEIILESIVMYSIAMLLPPRLLLHVHCTNVI